MVDRVIQRNMRIFCVRKRVNAGSYPGVLSPFSLSRRSAEALQNICPDRAIRPESIVVPYSARVEHPDHFIGHLSNADHWHSIVLSEYGHRELRGILLPDVGECFRRYLLDLA